MNVETITLREEIITNLVEQNKNSSIDADSAFDKIKAEAFTALSELDIPSSKNEEWKYTDITKVLKKNFDFKLKTSAPEYSKEYIQSLKTPGLDAYYLVLINGKFSKQLSNYPINEKDIIIETISDAYNYDHYGVRDHFSKHAEYKKDFFTALSTAFTEEGIFIRIHDGAVVEKPILFLFLSDSHEQNSLSQPRNLISIGRNCKATLVEHYFSKGTNSQFTNIVSEIVVGENAHVDYYKIQNEPDYTYHIGTTQVYQERNSNFSSTTITTSGGTVRNNLNIKLDGEGAEAKMYGLYLLNGKTHVDNHTIVDHAKPNALSNELYKGIMDDKSTGVFNGKIFVRKDAQKTNAFQSNRNVLLSDDATINTKPQLEIWADDVKCSHGATTGQIDEEALFYLQSRGISKDAAKGLLMIAFAREIVEVIKVKELKLSVEKLIDEILNN